MKTSGASDFLQAIKDNCRIIAENNPALLEFIANPHGDDVPALIEVARNFQDIQTNIDLKLAVNFLYNLMMLYSEDIPAEIRFNAINAREFQDEAIAATLQLSRETLEEMNTQTGLHNLTLEDHHELQQNHSTSESSLNLHLHVTPGGCQFS